MFLPKSYCFKSGCSQGVILFFDKIKMDFIQIHIKHLNNFISFTVFYICFKISKQIPLEVLTNKLKYISKSYTTSWEMKKIETFFTKMNLLPKFKSCYKSLTKSPSSSV